MNSKFVEINFISDKTIYLTRPVLAVRYETCVRLFHIDNGQEYKGYVRDVRGVMNHKNTEIIDAIIKYLKLNWDSLDTVIQINDDLFEKVVVSVGTYE